MTSYCCASLHFLSMLKGRPHCGQVRTYHENRKIVRFCFSGVGRVPVMEVEAPRRGSYAKTVQRRKQIIDAAYQVFSRAGFHNASLSDIAAAAGLSIAGVN